MAHDIHNPCDRIAASADQAPLHEWQRQLLEERLAADQHQSTMSSYPATLRSALVLVLCWGCSHPSQGTSNSDAGTTTGIGRDAAARTGEVWAIAAGLAFTCALLRTGVQCWGSTVQPAAPHGPSPVAIAGLDPDVEAIAAGGLNSCALAHGSAQCWGTGYGPPTDAAPLDGNLPSAAQGLSPEVQAMAPGIRHICALVNGAVWCCCWGSNQYNELGNNSTEDSLVPAAPVQWQ
jgi:hypothetical protein